MSALLDKIVAQAAGADRARVRVPEWDAEVWFRNLTPALRAQVRRGIKPEAVEELYVSTLCHLAQDEAGQPLFGTDPKTRMKLMASVNMAVLMRVLFEAGAEEDPRAAMITAASDDDVLQLLTQIGGANLGELADLPEGLIEAIRAVAKAPSHEIEAALGIEADPAQSRVKTAKNG